jgi:hypothetical protein
MRHEMRKVDRRSTFLRNLILLINQITRNIRLAKLEPMASVRVTMKSVCGTLYSAYVFMESLAVKRSTPEKVPW